MNSTKFRCVLCFYCYVHMNASCWLCSAKTVDGLDQSECPESGLLQMDKSEGYLSSYAAHAHGHGTVLCPWQVTVKPGQRVDLHLVDFSLSARYHVDHQQRQQQQHQLVNNDIATQAEHCFIFLTITESTKQSNICAGSRREQKVYSSLSHSLVIGVPDYLARDDSINFIVKYSAVGCPDIAVPPYAWLRRANSTITIGCNYSTHTWHLVCKHTSWIGQPASDCLQGPITTDRMSHFEPLSTDSLLAAVVVGVIIGAVFGLFVLATVFWCKMRLTGSWYPVRGRDLAMDPVPFRQPPYKEQRVPGEYGYTQVWELSPEVQQLLRTKKKSSVTVDQQSMRSHHLQQQPSTVAPPGEEQQQSLYRRFDDRDDVVVSRQVAQVYDRRTAAILDGSVQSKKRGNERNKCSCGQDATLCLESSSVVPIYLAEDKLQSSPL